MNEAIRSAINTDRQEGFDENADEAEEELAALEGLLKECAPIVDGALCPSVRHEGEEWTHHDLCKRIMEYLKGEE